MRQIGRWLPAGRLRYLTSTPIVVLLAAGWRYVSIGTEQPKTKILVI